jgi:hypothetical protein
MQSYFLMSFIEKLYVLKMTDPAKLHNFPRFCIDTTNTLDDVVKLYDELLMTYRQQHPNSSEVKFYRSVLNNEVLRHVFLHGRSDVAKWIIQTLNTHDIQLENIYLFYISCIKGELESAKLIHQVTNELNLPIDINENNGYIFVTTCLHGELEVVKWLYQLGNETSNPIDLYSANDSAFDCACRYKHVKLAEWLCEIEQSYHIELNENGELVDWYIKDMLNNISLTEFDKHTSLVRVFAQTNGSDELECMICCDTKYLYSLPCTFERGHIICGRCVLKLKKRSELKCPYCQQTYKLY